VAVLAFDERRALRLVNRAGEQLLAGARRRSRCERGRPGSRRVPRRAGFGDAGAGAARRVGPLRAAPRRVPAGGTAVDAGGALRRQPGAARRGAGGVAAADPGDRARAQQLAGTNQSIAGRSRSWWCATAAARFRGRPEPGTAHHRHARRGAQPLYERLRPFAKMPPATLAASRSTPGCGGSRRSSGGSRSGRAGPPVTIDADADQLDQALINLVRNAADASLVTGGGVRVGWRLDAGTLEVWVEDDGPGLPDSPNVFVPFFTTKPAARGLASFSAPGRREPPRHRDLAGRTTARGAARFCAFRSVRAIGDRR